MTTLTIVIALALIFDYINGFHDAANSIATVVSTKVLTPLQAVVWAAFFNFVAYFIFKDHAVANTIGKWVHQDFQGFQIVTLRVILSGLVAAILWNLLTWWYGIPSSSSHTLMGGFVGAAITHVIDKKGWVSLTNIVDSETIIKTFCFIILAPLIGMLISMFVTFVTVSRHTFKKIAIILACLVGTYFLFNNYKQEKLIKKSGDFFELTKLKSKLKSNETLATTTNINAEIETAKNKVNLIKPFLKDFNTIGPTGIAKKLAETNPELNINTEKLSKKLKEADNDLQLNIIFGIGFIFIIAYIYNEKIKNGNAYNTSNMFKKLQLLSSAAFSVGHGGNDAQKVMGIIAAAYVANGNFANVGEALKALSWVPLACYAAIGLGTMSGGWKIIKTMGTKITKVTPLEGVTAETSGAMTLFITEQMGIPVSTTHTITGCIMGVGATKRLSAVRWGVTINLLWAWILTIPISAILAMVVYFISGLIMK